MKKVLTALFMCYSLTSLAQNERKVLVESLLAGIETIIDIQYNQSGRPLFLDIYFPKGEEGKTLPCVVWIHGGALIDTTIKKDYDIIRWGIARTVQKGYINVSIDYRLVSENPLPAAIQDCETAIRFLKSNAEQYHIDTTRMAVVGESAGGYLAGFCAFAGNTNIFSTDDWKNNTNNLSCGVLWYPAISHPPFNMIDYISPDDIPVLSVHGNTDLTVPIEQSYQIQEKCKEKGVDFWLHVIKDSGHGFFDEATWEYNEQYRNDMEQAIDITISFLDKQLKR